MHHKSSQAVKSFKWLRCGFNLQLESVWRKPRDRTNFWNKNPSFPVIKLRVVLQGGVCDPALLILLYSPSFVLGTRSGPGSCPSPLVQLSGCFKRHTEGSVISSCYAVPWLQRTRHKYQRSHTTEASTYVWPQKAKDIVTLCRCVSARTVKSICSQHCPEVCWQGPESFCPPETLVHYVVIL